MAVRLVVAVTDTDRFNHLRVIPDLDEVNFWAPGAASFRALQPGELFGGWRRARRRSPAPEAYAGREASMFDGMSNRGPWSN